MLIGQFTSKLTDKDRISVPTKFRSELGDNFIVAKWYENCMVLIPKDNWSDLMKRVVGKADLIISPVRDIDRFVLGSAFEINLDKQGRFVLPDLLKKYTGISTEAVFVGLQDRVEVWSLERWKDLEKDAQERASKAIEKIARMK